MSKKVMVVWLVLLSLLMITAGWAGATKDSDSKEVLGVTFPGKKVVAGKTLYLNGVSYRKALGFMKVYAVGLYLEKKTKDPNEVIESEQIKHMVTHYLTDKVSAERLQKGFLETIKECNPSELITAHEKEINTYAGWLDKGTQPGAVSVSTYIPGKGLTLVYQGEEKGTIPGKDFAQMYYRFNVGEKANSKIRKGLLDQ